MTERADGEIRVIDPQRAYTWEGWGTCLSWWANTELGTRDDLAAVLFGLDPVKVRTTKRQVELPGLGLNIVRYNLGACTWTERTRGRRRMVESPAIVRRKQIGEFWDGEHWDWCADANQWAMLTKARDNGADTFEMFSVSPPWWMTANGNPSGAERGQDDNLLRSNQEAFAHLIAMVTRHARDEWGIRFQSVEPFNEPSLNAWHAGQNQEGCHFTVEAQEAVIACLRRELDGHGLRDVLIAASDECYYSQAVNTWRSFPEPIRAMIGRVNVHGYDRDRDPKNRIALRETVGDAMPVWQAEYSEGEPDGLTMALSIGRDVRYLRPRGWVCWQPVESLDWGLLDGGYDDQTVNPDGHAKGTLEGEVTGVNTKYYVLAHYTRHIRPMAQILDSGHADTVAALDPTARCLTLVTANDGGPRTVTYDLGRLIRTGGTVRTWVTDTSDSWTARHYTREPDTFTSDRTLTVHQTARTITTLEIDL
ncbi:glycoside hydrolase [Actinomadura fibrosa]|uniref:Glycoside hydrolase n=1 Tax=Actinomadura fibrosa TaxID=111802 RepID=A0ABW2XL47_9ACTN|nr:glycoside hydrolase [Actinomadura fibrosa]